MSAALFQRRLLLITLYSSFYRPSAYAIAQTVVDVPLVLVQVTIFDLVVYFMSGLARTPSQFFISLLILWIETMSMYSFFRALGALCKSLDVATRLTGVAIQALIVYTGYLIPPTKMHPWFKWLVSQGPFCLFGLNYGFPLLDRNQAFRLFKVVL